MTAAPQVPASSRGHALYRFYDVSGVLLYVGVTNDPGRRWSEHAGDKPWWHEVATITVRHVPSRALVLEAERDAIITERPRYNVAYNNDFPDTWEGFVLELRAEMVKEVRRRHRRRRLRRAFAEEFLPAWMVRAFDRCFTVQEDQQEVAR